MTEALLGLEKSNPEKMCGQRMRVDKMLIS